MTENVSFDENMTNSIFIINDTSTDIVVLIYSQKDSIQAIPYDQVRIGGNDASPRQLDMPHSEPCNLHVHFPGLFGLVSIRTRLTAGYGFEVHARRNYHIRLLESKDEFGNRCVVDDASSTTVVHKAYRIGDMFMKPLLRQLGVKDINFESNIFQSYFNRHQNNHDSSLLRSSLTDDYENDTGEGEEKTVTENEMWGVYFQQIYQTGVWCCYDVGYITKDDFEFQEPFLFIGLSSVALFNTIMRSLTHPTGIVFIDHRVIIRDTCPENFLPLFEMLMATKDSINQLPPITSNEITWIKKFLLYSGSRSFEGMSNYSIYV
jgi:hypothetical protein